MKWTVVFAKHVLKDAKKLAAAGLKEKAKELLEVLATDPFQNLPPFAKLVGDLEGACSRRINIQHRLVYEVFKKALLNSGGRGPQCAGGAELLAGAHRGGRRGAGGPGVRHRGCVSWRRARRRRLPPMGPWPRPIWASRWDITKNRERVWRWRPMRRPC
ncbi:MAG: Txe/YoeB family addiction module toxin [Burkholderiales bacterium]|nr:Txe/YoeB family addiction module toxin [Burkholderiales bacterium]